MKPINLKKIIAKEKNSLVLQNILSSIPTAVIIQDKYGYEFTLGSGDVKGNKHPIRAGEDIVGWVLGGEGAALVAGLIEIFCEYEWEIRELANETLEKYRELFLLSNISEKLTALMDVEEISLLVIHEVTKHIQATFASILLWDDESSSLVPTATVVRETLENKPDLKLQIMEIENILFHNMLQSGKPEVINNLIKNFPKRGTGLPIHSMICAPLSVSDKIIGLLTLAHDQSMEYSTDDLYLLNNIALKTALSLDNAKLYEVLNETFFETVKALAETIEMRDPYTGGHAFRVMMYSSAIGEVMGFSRYEINRLELAALMHDIGKIGINDEILLKTGRLTQEEFEVMKKHPEYGATILSNIKRLKDLIPGVRGHHERYDGSGYPDGLKRDEIPLFSRIISVADSFDAMTSDRSYRNAMSPESAFCELQNKSGAQFDGNIAAIFKQVYRDQRLFEIVESRHNCIKNSFTREKFNFNHTISG